MSPMPCISYCIQIWLLHFILIFRAALVVMCPAFHSAQSACLSFGHNLDTSMPSARSVWIFYTIFIYPCKQSWELLSTPGKTFWPHTQHANSLKGRCPTSLLVLILLQLNPPRLFLHNLWQAALCGQVTQIPTLLPFAVIMEASGPRQIQGTERPTAGNRVSRGKSGSWIGVNAM